MNEQKVSMIWVPYHQGHQYHTGIIVYPSSISSLFSTFLTSQMLHFRFSARCQQHPALLLQMPISTVWDPKIVPTSEGWTFNLRDLSPGNLDCVVQASCTDPFDWMATSNLIWCFTIRLTCIQAVTTLLIRAIPNQKQDSFKVDSHHTKAISVLHETSTVTAKASATIFRNVIKSVPNY